MLDLKIINGLSLVGNPLEIGIVDKKITLISQTPIKEDAISILDAKGSFISPGWIDSHVHCYENMELYYDYPDEIGVKKGVTTLIDAGSTGESNITEFYNMAEKAQTNVYALMNISSLGIVRQDELSNLAQINEIKNMERINELPNFILGIKARMSKTVVGENNLKPLIMAKELQNKYEKLPLMVHIGSAPPKLSDVLSILTKGDIVTHCYNGKPNGILEENGEIKEFVWDAYKKGLIFDIGHGTDSFNFEVAKKALQEGMVCQSISSDIYYRNRENGPVYDFSTTLDKMLALGVTLKDVIDMVTVNPAKIYNLKNKGILEVGKDADLTLFKVDNKEKELIDSNGNKIDTTKIISPKSCVVGGKVYEIGELR